MDENSNCKPVVIIVPLHVLKRKLGTEGAYHLITVALQLDQKALQCVQHNENTELASTSSACSTAFRHELVTPRVRSDLSFGDSVVSSAALRPRVSLNIVCALAYFEFWFGDAIISTGVRRIWQDTKISDV